MQSVHARDLRTDAEKLLWVEKFIRGEQPRYVFGCNYWGKSVAEVLKITAFIDDFTIDASFVGVPIVKSDDVPADAMVLSVVIVGLKAATFNSRRKVPEVVSSYSNCSTATSACRWRLPQSAERVWE